MKFSLPILTNGLPMLKLPEFRYIRAHTMDWPAIISSLKQAGVTQQQIAERCGVAQATVSDLARGSSKSPSFDFGTKLIALHAEFPAPEAKAAA